MGPLLSRDAVPLNLDDAPEMATGQRVSISEAMLPKLLEFFNDPEATARVKPGHVGTIEFTESRLGSKKLLDQAYFKLLPVKWQTVEKTPLGSITRVHFRIPLGFVTQEFIKHLHFVQTEHYEWELVP